MVKDGAILIYFSFCSLHARCQSSLTVRLIMSSGKKKGELLIITAWPATDVSVHLIRQFAFTCLCWGPVPGRAVTSTTAAMCFEWAEHWSVSQRGIEREGERKRTSRSRERVRNIYMEREREHDWGDKQLIGVSLLQLTVEIFQQLLSFSLGCYFKKWLSFLMEKKNH